MKKLMTGLCIALGLAMASQAMAETTECTEITTIPTVITVQGVYCLKGNLATAMTSGNAIEIQTNNVTIDFNGFKLGGLAAGPGTQANGVYADKRRNIVLRNGNIRGFYRGIYILGDPASSSGHLIEDMILDANRFIGIQTSGIGMIVRNNRIINTGPSDSTNSAQGIILVSASNGLITGNFISNTTTTSFNSGIRVLSSSLVKVRGNTVLETDGAINDRGIMVDNSDDTTVVDNWVLNADGTGSIGIYDFASSNTNCIGNTIDGFTAAVNGCDNDIGNNKL